MAQKKHKFKRLRDYPGLLSQWHPTRNGAVKGEGIRARSHLRHHWRCGACGREWRATPSARVKDPKCPACRDLGDVAAKGGRPAAWDDPSDSASGAGGRSDAYVAACEARDAASTEAVLEPAWPLVPDLLLRPVANSARDTHLNLRLADDLDAFLLRFDGPEVYAIRQRERWLEDLLSDVQAVRRALEGPLRVGFVGGFSSGKSALLNRLIGRFDAHDLLLREDVVPATARITHLRYHERAEPRYELRDAAGALVREGTLDARGREVFWDGSAKVNGRTVGAARVERAYVFARHEILQSVELIDTPGFHNDEIDSATTDRLVETVHCFLYLINPEGHLKDEDVSKLSDLLERGKKVAVVLTQVDRAHEEPEGFREDFAEKLGPTFPKIPILLSAAPPGKHRSRAVLDEVQGFLQETYQRRGPDLLGEEALHSLGRIREGFAGGYGDVRRRVVNRNYALEQGKTELRRELASRSAKIQERHREHLDDPHSETSSEMLRAVGVRYLNEKVGVQSTGQPEVALRLKTLRDLFSEALAEQRLILLTKDDLRWVKLLAEGKMSPVRPGDALELWVRAVDRLDTLDQLGTATAVASFEKVARLLAMLGLPPKPLAVGSVDAAPDVLSALVRRVVDLAPWRAARDQAFGLFFDQLRARHAEGVAETKERGNRFHAFAKQVLDDLDGILAPNPPGERRRSGKRRGRRSKKSRTSGVRG